MDFRLRDCGTLVGTRKQPQSSHRLGMVLLDLVRLFDYAAAPMTKRLIRTGARQATPPEGFRFGGTKKSLKAGELEQAAAWAKDLL